MAVTGPTRYAVKSCTVTFNSVAYEAESAPAMKGETKDAVEVTALTDQVKRYIMGALKETDEFSVTLYYKGSSDLTVDTAPAAMSLTVLLNNGVDSDVTVTVSYASCIITKVSPPTIGASSDRKAVYTVTFRPSGAAS